MLKRSLAFFLVIFMLLSFTACGEKQFEPSYNSQGESYKIGIMTGTVSQNEEEYRAAESVMAKYGDLIMHQTYPDNFMNEQEAIIDNILAIASDPNCKAIVICQAISGISVAIDKAREINPDILFIAAVPGEDPDLISTKADIVFKTDEISMGYSIIEQAIKQGAKTFVHYSFSRHMSYQLLALRRELFIEQCAEKGIKFVDVTAPDPTGNEGVTGAQQFILEDVPRKIEEFGKDTAFFSTNCSMQEPLIRVTLEQGGIYPQSCCPSPYHGFPGALEIDIPQNKVGNIDYVVEQISAKIAEKGGSGRFSTWPVPINMMFLEAGVEYAIAYLEGYTNGRVDKGKIVEIFQNYAGVEMKVDTLTSKTSGKTLENFFMVLSDYITF